MNDASRSRAERRNSAAAREAYRRDRLGSVDARRRVVAQYVGEEGWQPVRGVKLDDETARELSARGVTLVRVRRAGREVEVSLRRFIG